MDDDGLAAESAVVDGRHASGSLSGGPAGGSLDSGLHAGGSLDGGVGAGGSLSGDASADGALVPRLRLIEDQPLDRRAEAYERVLGELRDRLEGGDIPARDV